MRDRPEQIPPTAEAPGHEVILPREPRSAVVFASPHSGRAYPPDFLRRSRLDAIAIRSSEDAYVDLLFERAPEFGAPLIRARIPRAYVDFNRAEDELDPQLIEGVRGRAPGPRVSGGLGVIPRVVGGGRPIYRGRISRAEAEQRLADYWRPYHAALDELMAAQRARFGRAILFDCHSMPHEALAAANFPPGARPEVVLGDNHGAACSRELAEEVARIFRRAGLAVAFNAPFAGAFVIQRHGRPSRGCHALQIEIDRSLYLNERAVRPNANFQAFRELMGRITAELAALGAEDLGLAAE
ncbi:MAG: N-formylglutamate amidohydrolase [Alphaproteobacteria bacterium]|nr:MAG: N-formylglutamate amidohydrolase [Alphaproteobacteria bacterium]